MMRHTILGITVIFLGIGFIPANPARAVDYSCVPLEVAVLDNRAHVLCAAPNPYTRGGYPEDKGNQIKYFAVPLSDEDWSNRFIQIANMAITSGRPIIFSYNSGDYSGEAFGCSRNNCRTPWAYAILKTAYVPMVVSDSSPNISFDIPEGWSMVSLPGMPQSPLASNVFPDAMAIYSYSKDYGYLRVKGNEKMEAGKGYWILLPEAKSYTIPGDPIEEYSLSVENGWMMIGSCSCPSVPTLNTGSITKIYRFEKGSGYVRMLPSEVLESGEGYWIFFTGISKNTDLLVKCR